MLSEFISFANGMEALVEESAATTEAFSNVCCAVLEKVCCATAIRTIQKRFHRSDCGGKRVKRSR